MNRASLGRCRNTIFANFFTQLGLAEELGSGTRNLYKYSKLYSGETPVLSDGDFFEAFVPTPAGSNKAPEDKKPKMAVSAAGKVEKAVMGLLAVQEEITTRDIVEKTDSSERTVRRYLFSLVSEGILRVENGGRSTKYRLNG